MRKSIASADNLKVNPTIVNVVGEITFIDKLFRDVSKFDVNVFRTVNRGHEVEVLDVKACKFCITS